MPNLTIQNLHLDAAYNKRAFSTFDFSYAVIDLPLVISFAISKASTPCSKGNLCVTRGFKFSSPAETKPTRMPMSDARSYIHDDAVLTNSFWILVGISVLPPDVNLVGGEMHERHVLNSLADADDKHHSAVLGRLRRLMRSLLRQVS